MSEPEHISNILPRAMESLLAPSNRRRRQQGLPLFDKADNKIIEDRKARVLEATREYLSSNAKPPKKARRAPRERRLF